MHLTVSYDNTYNKEQSSIILINKKTQGNDNETIKNAWSSVTLYMYMYNQMILENIMIRTLKKTFIHSHVRWHEQSTFNTLAFNSEYSLDVEDTSEQHKLLF